MSTLRKHGDKWQSIVRVTGHPAIYKSFNSKTDASRWAQLTETKLRREDAGIAKIHFPKFEDLARRYIEEVSVHKKCARDERYTILGFIKNEKWSSYPINRILPNTMNRFRDLAAADGLSGATINRRLDVISSMFTTFKKEWSYPVENPVLAIRRPKRSNPRNRRFTDDELKKLVTGNHTSPELRSIITIALETGMRMSEILRLDRRHVAGMTLSIPVAKTKPRLIPLTKAAKAAILNAELPFTLSKYALDKQWRRLLKIYNIKGAVFHDLRDQSLTNFMKDKKLNVPETMIIAGHTDPRMLLRIYNNLEVEHVAKKLNS